MKKYILKNKFNLFIIFILSGIYYGLIAFLPIFVGRIIDNVMLAVRSGNSIAFSDYILFGAIIATSLLVINIWMALQKAKYTHDVRVLLENDVSKVVFDKNIESAKVTNLYNSEIDLLIEKFFLNIPNILAVAIPFLIGISYFALVSLTTLLIMIGCLLAVLVINQLILIPFAKYTKAFQVENTNMNRLVVGYLNGIKSINIFSGMKMAISRLLEIIDIKRRSEEKVNKYKLLIESINTLFSILMQLIPITILSIMIYRGAITVGEALAIILLFERIVAPIEDIGIILTDFSETRIIRKEIMCMVKSDEKLTNQHFNFNNYNIVFDNVSVKMGENYILKNTSYTFEENKKYLLLGSNGSGKSTLFRVLTKQETAYEGNIFIGNKNIKDLSEEELFVAVGVLTQNIEIIKGGIVDNIVFDNSYDQSLLEQSILSSGLKDQISLDNDRECDHFSGGGKQRISISRIFYHRKPILLLDEITSALHNKQAKHIEEHILGMEERLIIYISHRTTKDMQKHFDKVLQLRDGNLITL